MLQIIGLVITIGVIAWLILRKQERAAALAVMQQPLKTQFGSIRSASVYLIAMSGLILALTGLIPFLVFDKPMAGIILLIHVGISPLFILAVVAVTLLSAHSHRLNDDNWATTKACLSRKTAMPPGGGYRLWKNIMFWLMVLATILLGSIVLSMYSLFSTVGMKFFLNLHKFAALLFLIAGAGYIVTALHGTLPATDD